MRYLYGKYLLLTVIACCLVACSDDSENGKEEIPAPALVSSLPAAGADNIAISNGNLTLSLVFDQDIKFPATDKDRISLGEAIVREATANGKTLTLQAGGVTGGKTYTLFIPKGIIQGAATYNNDLSISFTTTPEMVELKSPCDKQATEKTKKLYTYLLSVYGEKTLSSTMANVNWNNTEAENVYKLTGKYPAMNGYDFIHIHYSPANWIDYSDITPVAEWADAGGLVSLMWHMMVPKNEHSSEYTYTPAETSFRASNIFIDGTWENIFFYQQMDKVCNTLKQLQQADIPALWRPFHEAAGNRYRGGDAWFWWGDEGAEVYVELWKRMYGYFQEKGIHNLIWVWTTQTGDSPYYPGDNYVDIIGRDLYGETATNTYQQWNTVNTEYPEKMIALSECGNRLNGQSIVSKQAIIPEQWSKGCRWLYFMPWYDYDYSSGNSTTNIMCDHSFWEIAMSRSYVLTREDVKHITAK